MQKIFYKNEKIIADKRDEIFQINRTKNELNKKFYKNIPAIETIKNFFELNNIKVDNHLNIIPQ
jgi:hypothetical protein